jgi:hypothetical protein
MTAPPDDIRAAASTSPIVPGASLRFPCSLQHIITKKFNSHLNHLRWVTSRNNRNAEDTSRRTSAPTVVTNGSWVWAAACSRGVRPPPHRSGRGVLPRAAYSHGSAEHQSDRRTPPRRSRAVPVWLHACGPASVCRWTVEVKTLSPNPSLVAVLSRWSRGRQPHQAGSLFLGQISGWAMAHPLALPLSIEEV